MARSARAALVQSLSGHNLSLDNIIWACDNVDQMQLDRRYRAGFVELFDNQALTDSERKIVENRLLLEYQAMLATLAEESQRPGEICYTQRHGQVCYNIAAEVAGEEADWLRPVVHQVTVVDDGVPAVYEMDQLIDGLARGHSVGSSSTDEILKSRYSTEIKLMARAIQD